MLRALIGFISMLAIVMVIAMLVAPRVYIWSYDQGGNPKWLLLTVVVLPAIVVWAVMEVLHIFRPRRILIGERRSSALLIGWGFALGLLTTVTAALTMAWLDRDLSDALIFSGCAALATVMMFPILPRRRKGHCVYCNYDQRGATARSGGQCVECGKLQPV